MNQTLDGSQLHSAGGSTASVALRLFRMCGGGEAPAIVLGLVLLLLGTGASLLAPWPMKLVIDAVISGHDAPGFLSKLAHAMSQGNQRISLLVLLCAGQLVLHVIIGALS